MAAPAAGLSRVFYVEIVGASRLYTHRDATEALMGAIRNDEATFESVPRHENWDKTVTEVFQFNFTASIEQEVLRERVRKVNFYHSYRAAPLSPGYQALAIYLHDYMPLVHSDYEWWWHQKNLDMTKTSFDQKIEELRHEMDRRFAELEAKNTKLEAKNAELEVLVKELKARDV